MDYSSDDTKPVGLDKEAGPMDEVLATDKEQNCEEESEQTTTKKRTWRKPKDKPKRPLSAYNIFFQHARARVVEGITNEETPEEVIRSIEGILSKSRQKRRHRKSHGKISFGDLARTIAEQWKSIHPKRKEIFDHYAEIDMVRYRRELKVWKEKKDQESEATAIEKHSNFVSQLGSSYSSSTTDPFCLDVQHGESSSDATSLHDSLNSSHSSFGDMKSSERRRMKSESMNMMIQRQQQQLFQQQLYAENPTSMIAELHPPHERNPGSYTFHQSSSTLPANYGDFEVAPETAHVLQRLKLQQAMQVNQMRQLQIQQFQLQQQLEFHRNRMSNSGSVGTGNTMSMGQSTFLEPVGNQSFMSQPQQHLVANQKTAFANHSSLDQSLNLQEVVHGQTPYVSDYSSSNGFVSSSFASMNQSTNTVNSSFGGLNQQQSPIHRMFQQSNNLSGQGFAQVQTNLSGSDFSFSSGKNKANKGVDDTTSTNIQHDRRGMDMDL